tara:strand:- start:14016 stop:15551 length:1536 start_codon:yes stop_codon:yes gene_type:complete
MKKLFGLSISLLIGLLNFVHSQTLPIDFETTTSWSAFAGASFATVSNPFVDSENLSSKVGRMIKGAGQNWAGAYLTLGSPMDFLNNDTFSIKVHSSKLNTKLLLKVENSSNSTINFEKEVTLTKYNEWETLVFDFSQIPNENYDQIVLIFDLGITGNGSSSFTYFIDDITLYSLNGPPEPCDSNLTGNIPSGSNYVLVWSDEFTEDGDLCYENWTYDLGNGYQGWGNFEAQSYTNNSENVRKENGKLKITALKSGNSYTSARVKTKNLFDFTYGRIEIRAKLPSTAGTWPAVWLLGSNINEVSWPQCGEIDIIEQFSNKQENISTAHWYSDGNAQYGLSVNNSTLTSNFNTFRLDWTPTSLTAYLNDSQYWVMSTNNTMPFFDNFFLIANLALGGNKGAGNIDPNFSEDSLEIDYIRVYQNSSGSVLSSETTNGNQNIINYYNSNGEWHFKSSSTDINDIFIYDILGKLIEKQNVGGKMAKINLKNLQNGLYFIQLSGNFGFQIIKILNKN